MSYNWMKYKEGISLSYDYEDLIQGLASDIDAGLVSDKIAVVRTKRDDTSYEPIIDYYALGDKLPINETYSIEHTAEVLVEMNEMNKMF